MLSAASKADGVVMDVSFNMVPSGTGTWRKFPARKFLSIFEQTTAR